MIIADVYSHLNGLEYLQVHQPRLWNEICYVITSVDANACRTKMSHEKNRIGEMLISPTALNNAFNTLFNQYGWYESRVPYYVTNDLDVSRQAMNIPNARDQRQFIESHGFQAFNTYNQVDFVKDKVAVEVQFGKYFSVQYDLHVKHTFFYNRGDINVGIEMIPTHNMMRQMSSGIAWYENELMNIVREGRSNPSVPIVLIGIEP